jgi:hypothetical protein
MKETFIIRTEWMDSILELQPEEQAEIFRNLFHFHSGNENLINLNNLSVKLVWKLIAPNLQRNITAYDKRSLTSAENGRKGGRPSDKVPDNQETKPNSNNLNNLTQKPTLTKEPIESLSVSVSDSDSVSVSDSDNKENAPIGFSSFEEKPKTEIPEDFPFTGEYAKQAMIDYIKHRKQMKVKPYTKIGLEKAMKEWSTWGEAVFIEQVNQTIRNNWQGIFPPKSNTYGTNQTNNRQVTGRVEPAPAGTAPGKF